MARDYDPGMGRWDPLPPSTLERFIAGHVFAVQVCLAPLCIANLVMFVLQLRAAGPGFGALGSLLAAVGVALVMGLPRNTARRVARYDARRDSTITPTGSD